MNTNETNWRGTQSPQRKQQGVIAVIVAIGMAALIGVVGLALDSGHLLLNKTRLQNAVDAAALSGARTLQQSVSATPLQDARAAAIATFTTNLSSELNGDAPVPTVTFSEDLTPGSFMAATANPPSFIKVSSPVISLTSFLIKAVGFDDKRVAAVAVAGFGNGVEVCGLLPVTVCEGNDTSPGNFRGYKIFNPSTYDPLVDTITLKVGSGDGPDTDVGTGSFHLIDLPGLQGGNDIRYAFAGSPACGTLDETSQVDLAPGNKVGPLVQGVNTRFGLYSGPLNGTEDSFPPDYANQDDSSSCAAYSPDYGDTGTGPTACLDPRNYHKFYDDPSLDVNNPKYLRRKVTIPIADCDGTATGNDLLPTLGFGCFLLTEPASQTGGANSDSGSLKGVFLEDCTPPAEGVTESSGATIILLYRNPDGVDS